MSTHKNRLFVGGIPWKMGASQLRELFSEVGKVTATEVAVDQFSGRSRGFGFVEFSTEEEAVRAIQRFHNTPYEKLILKVSYASLENESKGDSSKNM